MAAPAKETQGDGDKPAADPDDLIPRDRIISEARAFTGYDPHEVAGALAGVKGDAFDPHEVKSLTREWLKSPEEAT